MLVDCKPESIVSTASFTYFADETLGANFDSIF
jgi:hypothetical protein